MWANVLKIDGREWLARESMDPDSPTASAMAEGPKSQRSTDKIQALHK